MVWVSTVGEAIGRRPSLRAMLKDGRESKHGRQLRQAELEQEQVGTCWTSDIRYRFMELKLIIALAFYNLLYRYIYIL